MKHKCIAEERSQVKPTSVVNSCDYFCWSEKEYILNVEIKQTSIE